jgi:hypothetical protein
MGGAAMREVLSKVDKFSKEWTTKFNSLVDTVNTIRKGVASIATGVAQSIGQLKANIDVQGDALETLDAYNQVWGRVMIRLMERIYQADMQIQQGIKDPKELTPEQVELIKAHAEDYFRELVNTTMAQVKEDRARVIAEMRAKAEAEQKAQEQAKSEQQVAEETMLAAEKNISTPGGDGAEIPAGAEVFGGH